jgi:hypothetical protein
MSSIASPSITLPEADTSIVRSASPSKATPSVAPVSITFFRKISGWSEPQSLFMFCPSGSTLIAVVMPSLIDSLEI